MKNKLLFILLAVLFFSSCRKDDIVDTSINPPPAAEVFYSADIIGKVIDQDGIAIENADVSVAGQVISTDVNGLFRWEDLNMAAQYGTYLETKAEGYFESGYRIYAGGTYDRAIEITLVKKEISGYVNGTTGSVITLDGGLEINFPANAFTSTDGDYNGLVTVHAYHLDPSEEDYLDRSPGDLSGTDETGANYILESFGMVAVEMETADGQYVQLRDGVTATLTVPVDNSLLGDAPATIPLWHFDDIQHQWVKEGQAELVNGKYVGEVSHFSWWNCDDFTDAASLCIQVFDGRYQGSLENIVVELTSESQGTTIDVTDSNGNVGGLVPANETFQITIYDQCGEVIYTGTIGPYTGDDNKEVIPVVLSNVEIYAFSGTVFDCDANGPLSDAIVTVFVEGKTYYAETDDNGVYSINLLICEVNTEYTVSAFSSDVGLVGSESGIVTPSVVNVLDVNLCDETPYLLIFGADGEQIWPTAQMVSIGWADNITCIRRPNENIIRSHDVGPAMINDDLTIGFSGNAEGTYPASLVGQYLVFATNDVCTVTITKFDSHVGGFIKGNVEGTNLNDGTQFTGSFVSQIIE